jgi:hypothetical protein
MDHRAQEFEHLSSPRTIVKPLPTSISTSPKLFQEGELLNLEQRLLRFSMSQTQATEQLRLKGLAKRQMWDVISLKLSLEP